VNRKKISKLTAIIPISPFRDDFDQLSFWISKSDLTDITLIFVFDKCNPSERFKELVNICNADKVLMEVGEFNSPGLARNHGLHLVESTWTCFWDSDDIPDIRSVKLALFELEGQEVDLGICEYKTADWLKGKTVNNTKYQPHQSTDIFQIIKNPGIWRFIFKSKFITSFNFPSTLMGEDQVFLALALKKHSSIYWVSKSTYTYLRHNGSQLTKSSIAVDDLINSSYLINQLLSSNLEIDKEVCIALILKQSLTIIRKSPILLKYKSVKLVSKVLIFYPLYSIRVLLRFFKLVCSKKVPNTYVVLNGGLGNQLFELTAGLNLSHGENLYIESSVGYPRTTAPGVTALESFEFSQQIQFSRRKRWRLFSRAANYLLRNGLENRISITSGVARISTNLLAIIYLKSPVAIHVNQGIGWNSIIPSRNRSQLLIGYFQSFRFQTPEILILLKDSFQRLQGKELSKIKILGLAEKPLIVHVRLTDYLDEPNFGIPSNSFYFNAIRQIYNPSIHKKIWLYSDEIEKAMDRIPIELHSVTRPFKSVDDNENATLVAMSQGHDFVIANSTFSWWAARLSVNPDATVVYPSPWFKGIPEPIDLFPPHWRPFPAEFQKS